MKKIFFLTLVLFISSQVFSQKAKYGNVTIQELTIPDVIFPKDIKTFQIFVKTHDLDLKKYGWSTQQIQEQLKMDAGFEQVEQNPDFSIHIDLFGKTLITKFEKTNKRHIQIPSTMTWIDGAGKTFRQEEIIPRFSFLKAEMNGAIDFQVDSLIRRVIKVAKYDISNTIGGSGNRYVDNLFRIKKSTEEEEAAFLKAFKDAEAVIEKGTYNAAVRAQIQPSVDFWEAGLTEYNPTSTPEQYVACGYNLMRIAMLDSDFDKAAEYHNKIKDIKNPWIKPLAKRMEKAKKKLEKKSNREKIDITGFAEGGYSPGNAESHILVGKDRIKMENGDIKTGTVDFIADANEVYSHILLSTTLNDFEIILISDLVGGVMEDGEFTIYYTGNPDAEATTGSTGNILNLDALSKKKGPIVIKGVQFKDLLVDTYSRKKKVEPKTPFQVSKCPWGYCLFDIVKTDDQFALYRHLGTKGNTSYFISDFEAEKIYGLDDYLNVNKFIINNLNPCKTVADRANNSEYSKKEASCLQLIDDLNNCN